MKLDSGQRKEAGRMYHIGIDMHKRFSRVEVMNDEGQVRDTATLFHDNREDLRAWFRGIGRPAVATIEATRNWYWLFELLEEEGLEVKLAHPLKVRLIAEARIKTDAIDAHVLASGRAFSRRPISPRGMYGTTVRCCGIVSLWSRSARP
jgi:transposase